MGNEHPNDRHQPFQLISTLDGNKNILRHKQSNQQFVSVQRLFPTSDQLHSYLTTKDAHLKFTHQYYLNQKSHQIVSQANICSTVHKFVQYFKYEQHNLRKQLNNRQTHGKHFSYQQIWSIICSCVLAMAHITRNQILHFTLNPNDIAIDQNGHVKIISSDLSQNIEDHIINSYYYSPQHLKSFKQNTSPQLTNKSGVFTLGMTILQILSLTPMDKFYDYYNFHLDYQGVIQMISKVEDNQIRSILQKMLKFQSYQRITFTELQQMLYFVLEKDVLEDTDLTQEPNQQIQKLQQSIFKIQKKKQQQAIERNQGSSKRESSATKQNSNKQIALCPLESDHSDLPNICQMLISQIDKQNPNEQQNAFMDTQTKNQNLHNSQHKENLVLQQNNHLLNTPIFKSSLQTKNLETHDKTHSNQNRIQPYYVTETLSRGKYQGYKVGNMRNGFGTFYYKQGGKYVGQWVMNKMEGRGALYYSNQQIAYEGEWKSDKLNGHGVLYNETPNYTSQGYDYKSLHIIDNNWIKYQGNFIQDQKNGEGTLFLSNGQFYRGYFKNDLPHGNGIYKKINGSVIKGNWILGVLQNTDTI